jgi:hypothetical protein
VKYVVASGAEADHVLVDVAPSATGYAVTTQASGSVLTVSIAPGGAFKPSADGVLGFELSKTGQPKPPSGPGTPGSGGAGGAGGAGGSGAGGSGTGGSGTGGSGTGGASSAGASGSGDLPPCSEVSPCVDDVEPTVPGQKPGQPERYPMNLDGC